MFTAEQAFEASQDGDPILMTIKAASQLCADHSAHLDEYHTDQCESLSDAAQDDWLTARANDGYDAGHLLAWLGY